MVQKDQACYCEADLPVVTSSASTQETDRVRLGVPDATERFSHRKHAALVQEAGLTSSVAPATGEPAVAAAYMVQTAAAKGAAALKCIARSLSDSKAVSSAPSTTVPVGEIGYVIPRNEQCPKGLQPCPSVRRRPKCVDLVFAAEALT